MLCLGGAYRKKNIDHAKAEKWYRYAYENGSLTAMISLGIIYFMQQNYSEAEKLFLVGASQGDGASMYWLGRIYLLDSTNEARSSRVRTLWEDAAARGNINAKYGLGIRFLKNYYGAKHILKGFWLCLTALVDIFRVGCRDPYSPRLW
jgi:TPR repeat protein